MIPRLQKDSQGKIEGEFYPLQKAELIALRKAGLIVNTAFVYFALHLEDIQNGAPLNVKEFATSWQIPESSVYEAIAKINRANPSFTVKIKSPVRVEQQIRDYLHAQLGGLVEVATPSGRIDLLTKTEIIEVKRINEWKSALGQILIYSAFYPQHQKRLHLFGTARELEALADIEAAVISFEIKVTGEEV
ncbi:hypothetical protein [Chroococcidiopsis sp.]|uniref:hypothetical protein n=1 Tax=Chroococcidiopsis sp. TaxID=3088168 RepID=UPI003F323DC6